MNSGPRISAPFVRFRFFRKLSGCFAFYIIREVTESVEFNEVVQILIIEFLDQQATESPFAVPAADDTNNLGQEKTGNGTVEHLHQFFFGYIDLDSQESPGLESAIQRQLQALDGDILDPPFPGVAGLMPADGFAKAAEPAGVPSVDSALGRLFRQHRIRAGCRGRTLGVYQVNGCGRWTLHDFLHSRFRFSWPDAPVPI